MIELSILIYLRYSSLEIKADFLKINGEIFSEQNQNILEEASTI